MSENKSIRRFNLDLHKLQSQISVSAFQYNTAIRLDIGITDGGIPYKIEEGTLATLIGKREEDNSNILHTCTIIENRIIYDFQESTTEVLGVIKCNIKLSLAGQEKLTSPEFIIVVGEEAVNGDTIIEDYDNLSALDEYLGKIQEALAAEDKRDDAEKERADAEGVRFDNEEERKKNEIERKTNEDKRIEAEKERADGYAQMDAKIDAKIDGKVDKTTESFKLYGTQANGKEYLYMYSYVPRGSALAMYAGRNNGVLTTNAPVEAKDCTNKEYVDTQITEKVGNISNNKIDALEERVSDLENLTLTNINDSSKAYEKVAPAKVGSTAFVDMIGGAKKTSTVIGENKLNPYDVSFSFETDYSSSYVNEETGVIDVDLSDGGGYAEIYGLDAKLDYGEYYVYIEGLDEEDNVYLSENVTIYLHGLWDENGIPEERIVHLKIMVKEKALVDDESYYFVEAPVGTVFEPYTSTTTYEPVKVEKIESLGANLFDISKVVSSKYVINNGDSLTVNTSPTSPGVSPGGYPNIRLIDYCPDLKKGNTYTLNAKTTGSTKHIWLQDRGMIWKFGESLLIDDDVEGEDILNSKISFYASGVNTTATISEIMINIGTTAAPYEPFESKPIDTYEIPEDVIIRDGYGREGSSIEFRDDDIYLVVTKDENLQLLPTPEETIITSDFFSGDSAGIPYIKVQGGGRLRFVNNFNMDVPSSVWYTVRRS